jgi:hypothetical protein
MTETNVIGVDVWWDHTTQKFKKKKVNLKKVPLEFRCPNCGKILAGTSDRDSLMNPTSLDLGMNGGVCEKCHFDGFGKYGEYGLIQKAQFAAREEREDKIRREKEKLEKERLPPNSQLFHGPQGQRQLVINGQLTRLVKGVIDIEHEVKT